MADFHETVFLGGGLSCLAAAAGFRGDGLVLEAEARPGGLCRSERLEGFTFDRTGHLLHLRHPRTRGLVEELLGANRVERTRDTWVHSHGVTTRYPFQSNFHGLPTEVAVECLLGVIEAHVRAARRGRHGGARPPEPTRFDRWVLERFGPGVARHFMFPYNRKLWTVPPGRLTTEWLGRFVPRPELGEVIRGALSDRPSEAGYNARFLYPRRGGIEALVRALARRVPRLHCGARVVDIDLRARRLRLADGTQLGFGRLVSAVPLPALVRMCHPLPDGVRAAGRALRWSSVYNLNLGVRERGERRHWVYVPEERFALYRFGYASNFSPAVAPEGWAAVYTEVAFDPRRPPALGDLRARVLRDLVALGVIRSLRDVRVECPLVLEHAYAIYDRARSAAVARALGHFRRREIVPIGRYGRWEYSSMEDALIQGLEAADLLNNTK
ncbi:MAG TPA: FAD-dependent oxidoreductase [Myxococcota bacterium]|nr:FAD-dependent oxidoreductase [Myxococcota bacterium]HRY96695.1 FAD-dependent oxidoreductase [Myxococcota bacterium]HSA20217.1 FAD-dependent oxidoreductase [Myxococcota bacterium]